MNTKRGAALIYTLRVLKIGPAILLLMLALPAPPRGASLSASPVASCACCAEPGEWYERTGKVEQYEIEELRRVEFGKTASVYLTAAGFEGMKGLPAEYDSFGLKYSYNTNHFMTLVLRGERGETGSLILQLPRVATYFGADLHDMPLGSSGPILYKEWRFRGTVRATGAFKKGVAPGTKFHLILQGRGNSCLSSSDFKNWRLDVDGTRASYSFYGDLSAQ